MNGLMQLSELARLLKTIAKTARYVAHHQKRRAAEILWIAHQIEELADELGDLSGLPPERRRDFGTKAQRFVT